MAAYKEYSDTAVIVISRCGTESADLSAGTLKLSEIEAGLVDKVATTFGKVIVLFNIDNIVEMGFLEEYDNIQAAAIIWAPGEVGMDSVGKMLSGEVNPSGKLADTIAYHIEDHPSNENFGDYRYSEEVDSSNRNPDAFVEYEEGIYVGYRYFETFENARDSVQYPFGYGLSYTDFAWNVESIAVAGDTVTATVEVTNTGDVAGKDVVQVYFSAPYTGAMEKPAVELAAFAKTKELAPDESQTLTVTYDVEDTASYDMERAAWVMEAGTYDIRVFKDSKRSKCERKQRACQRTG